MPDLVSRLDTALKGRYRIERKLGQGGMATVYLAVDLRHEREVALKVLVPELVSAVGSTRFLREIRIAAGLRHPHILPLLDSGDADGFLYYTMPVVRGGSLRDRLKREKQLPVDEAIFIASEVAGALSHSHANGVIHRDIKPSNIMLDEGRAVVTDYGIALVVQSASKDRLTASGFSPGSPEYMSPEQAAGESQVDARSDIYSLGCVLFELLAGDPPFTGSIPQAILAKKLLASVPSLRVVRDSVPPHVEAAVTTALAKSPADRFRSAEEFRQALTGEGLGSTGASVGGADVLRGRSVSLPLDSSERLKAWSAGALAALVVGVAAVLTGIGFLSTIAYDVTLNIPAEYTPSRTDFPIVGARALVPAVFYGFAVLVAYVSLRYVWRAVVFGLVRVPRVGPTLESMGRRSSAMWFALWKPLSPTTVADVYFVSAVLSGVLLITVFWGLLLVFFEPHDTGILSPMFQSLHQGFYFSFTLLVIVLAAGYHRVFRYVRRREGGGGRVIAAKWGSLAWMIILVVIMTLPWRLIWNNEHPRALFNGDPAYILIETDAEVVIYRPGTQSTERYRKDGSLDLERLGTIGYLFEGMDAFEDADP